MKRRRIRTRSDYRKVTYTHLRKTGLARLFREEQLLDLLMLAGWYHAISFTANGARVACEDGAPRFADVQSLPSR